MQVRTALSTLAAGALVLGTALPSQATTTPTVEVISSDVLAPFNLATRADKLYVADGFTVQVSQVTPTGLVPLQNPGTEDVAGLAFAPDGTMAWTQTDFTAGTATLEVRGRDGSSRSVDLHGFEYTRNPDRHVEYGVNGPGRCVREALEAIEAPVEYRGVKDAHPYAVASWGDGWLVADAGGNDVVRVNRNGKVSLVAVLPPQRLTFTAESAAALGLPDCVVGKTYRFEPVPTDVEVGPDGLLYVSTLPGGPEDPSLGARGAVYKVNPSTGRTWKLADGLLGATNLAVGPDGTVYATELFSGRVSVVTKDAVTPFVEIPNALSVEADADGLWVGTLAPLGPQGPQGPGTVVRVTW